MGPWRTPITARISSSTLSIWAVFGSMADPYHSCSHQLHPRRLSCFWVHGGPLAQQELKDQKKCASCFWVHGGPLAQHGVSTKWKQDKLFLGPWRTPSTAMEYVDYLELSCFWVHGGPLAQLYRCDACGLYCCFWVHGGPLSQQFDIGLQRVASCFWVHGGPLSQLEYC